MLNQIEHCDIFTNKHKTLVPGQQKLTELIHKCSYRIIQESATVSLSTRRNTEDWNAPSDIKKQKTTT